MRRYRCRSADCGWQGLVYTPQTAASRLASAARWPGTWIIACLLSIPLAILLAGGEWLEEHADPAVTANRRESGPAESSPNSPLKPTGRLTYGSERRGELPSGCVWGGPGEHPYAGTLLDALIAAQLPSEVIRKLVIMQAEDVVSDHLEISSAGIYSTDHRRSFGYTTKAMALDDTVCLNTKINLSGASTSAADLYEVIDRNDHRYTIMIVTNGRNVALLQEQSGR